MEEFEFSLLYPSRASREAHAAAQARPHVSAETAESIGLSALIKLKNSVLTDYFTSDPAVIAYRAENFRDMLQNPGIAETFVRVLPILSDIGELRRMSASSDRTTDEYLLSLSEIELYISAMETMHEGLTPLADKLTSKAFRDLAAYIRKVTESDYYKDLNEKLRELTVRVRDIKSVTIGVNLDSTLRADKCGVLSINPRPFKSGDTIDELCQRRIHACRAALSLCQGAKRQPEDGDEHCAQRGDQRHFQGFGARLEKDRAVLCAG